MVVIHGGPGAPGSAGPLAAGLADPFHVVEPWQRWSGEQRSTVDRHVADLAVTLDHFLPSAKPIVVGESWGAMLALVFAARHSRRVAALVLVGCGTFDEVSRATLHATLDARTTPGLRARLEALAKACPDETDRMLAMLRLCDPLYTFARSPDAPLAVEHFDPEGHRQSWQDMMRLQASGEVPSAFAAIECPVLMVHGIYDPHPGQMIRDVLQPQVPQLEYHELDRCGHSPWVELGARDAFFALVRSWSAANAPAR